MAKILVLAGSTREGSFNKKLARLGAKAAEDASGSVTLADLRDYPMPLYDGDLEAASGVPQPALAMKALMLAHQGFLFACPEYNGSITGVLKNTIDWASRPVEGESTLECFRGKVVSLLSASPGGLGGLRGLVHIRAVLGDLGCIVLPDQLAISRAHEAFDEDGRLVNANQHKRLSSIASALVSAVEKFTAE